MKTENITGGKIFLLPAERRLDQKLSFVFSYAQVTEILKDICFYNVPFCPGFIKGVAERNNRLVPVLCLQEMMGIKSQEPHSRYKQFIVVRSTVNDPSNGENLLGVIASASGLQFPRSEDEKTIAAFKPCAVPDFLINRQLVRGMYRNRGLTLISLDFEKILLGTAFISQDKY